VIRPVMVGSTCAVTVVATIIALNVQGAAPEGHYTINSVTVFDNKTKLTWQRAPSPQTYTWQKAIEYCTGLGLGGLSWRLPTVRELQTLVDRQAYRPSIDAVAFPNTPAEEFWSSSPSAGSPGDAWYVNFNYGNSYDPDRANTYWVRCVR
jgi:hypothetical protein